MAKSKQPGHNNASDRDKPSQTNQEPVIDGSQPLKKYRYELYCRNIVHKVQEQAEAYRNAGFKPKTDKSAWEAASRLSSTVKVQARINWLREKEGEKYIDSAEKLVKFWERGVSDTSLSEAVRLRHSELLGKHLGILAERRIIEDATRQRELTESEEQEARELARIRLIRLKDGVQDGSQSPQDAAGGTISA